MLDVILQVIMVVGAGIAGYGIRALQYPAPKRGKDGRFVKDD